jgi:hypothetical protein
MPKQSRRVKAIKRLRNLLKERLKFRVIRELADEDDDLQDMLDGFVAVRLDEVESQRYFGPRGRYRKRRKGRFEDDLEVVHGFEDGRDGEHPWLNADEFLQKYRCRPEALNAIVDLIKDHPVFKDAGTRGRPQVL